MVQIITNKPSVGVSACLFNCPVRYNGKKLNAVGKLGRERADFAFTPVCPECMAGFGVPRESIHLTGSGQQVLAGTAAARNHHGVNVTSDLIAGCQASIEALERAGVRAVILKEESPTCGLFKARIGKKRREQVTGSGVFGAMLREKGWFLIPDKAFDSALTWWDWRRRLHAWLWLSDRSLQTNGELTDAWHVVKFIVQETDRPFADEVGRALAGLPKNAPPELLEKHRKTILHGLERPTTRARATQALWKTYANLKNHGKLEGVDLHDLTVNSPEVRRNVTTIAAELTSLERVAFENDLLFGTSPVIYRDVRRVRAQAARKTDTQ
ncbi:MAG: DUF523 domain-containing protein [Coriobacteriia bacterium]|nr:DUF523 domain-containing protein [Coriobacteriia bacterium]